MGFKDSKNGYFYVKYFTQPISKVVFVKNLENYPVWTLFPLTSQKNCSRLVQDDFMIGSFKFKKPKIFR
jgi:hypothetical protein